MIISDHNISCRVVNLSKKLSHRENI